MAKLLTIGKRFAKKPQILAFLVAAMVFLGLMLLNWQIWNWYENRLIKELQAQSAEEVFLRANTLSTALNRRIASLRGLKAFVLAESGTTDLEGKVLRYAGELSKSTEGILRVDIAPDATVRYVYPLRGNETLINTSLFEEPNTKLGEDAIQSVETGEIVISAPMEFGDDDPVIVATQAVFDESGFWGFVRVVLDMSTLLKRALLDEQTSELGYAVRDNEERLIYGSRDVFTLSPVVQTIDLGEGFWVLAGAPQSSWLEAVTDQSLIVRVSSIVIAGLLAGIVYLTVNRQRRLTEGILQRTQQISHINLQLQKDVVRRKKIEAELVEREAQYRSIFESTTDGLFINDLNGRLVDFNPAASEMHGYTVEEFRCLQPSDFIHPDYFYIFNNYIETVRVGGTVRDQAIDVCKDGSQIVVEVYGKLFIYKGEPHALAVVRDVTEENLAYQLLEKRVEERTKESFALLEVARTVTSTLELEQLLGVILDQLKGVVDYSGAGIAVLEGDDFTFLDYRGPATCEKILELQFPANLSSGFREAFQSQSPVIYTDLWKEIDGRWDPRLAEILHEPLGYVCSWVGVPLAVRDSLIGVLWIDHELPGRFNESHAWITLAFANQAAVAMENARLYEEAQSLASLRERQRIARELHDSVSQSLYGIALGARTAFAIAQQTGSDQSTLIESLEYILTLAEAGLSEMRALIFELRPESLEQDGLVVSLTKQCERMGQRNNIKIKFDLCEEPDVPLEVKESLYRVAQEAVNNTVKHALATEIYLSLCCDEDEITLQISDNGRGFDPGGKFPGHFGLQSMRERIERLGGSLKISSEIDQGSQIFARIPLM